MTETNWIITKYGQRRKNIIDILTDNHLITTGWTAYESVCLHYNDKTLIIKQYGGQAPDSGVDYLRVQIMAIALNPLGARDILQSIYNFFFYFFLEDAHLIQNHTRVMKCKSRLCSLHLNSAQTEQRNNFHTH